MSQNGPQKDFSLIDEGCVFFCELSELTEKKDTSWVVTVSSNRCRDDCLWSELRSPLLLPFEVPSQGTSPSTKWT